MKPKVIFYPSPERALSREEIQHIFAQYSPQDPLMIALRQIMVERLASATVDSTDPRLNERLAGIAAGRITEISSLQQELADFHSAGTALRKRGAVEPAAKPKKAL